MLRRICVALLTAVTLATACADVWACGDKFLRMGRSARFRRYASVHPSAILVYAPGWTATGIKDLETMLKRAGHRVVTVTNDGALSSALAKEKFEIVIASYTEAAAIRKELDATPAKPTLLPVVYKLTKTEEADARAAYYCVLKPEKMTKFDALEEIDRAIARHLAGVSLVASAR